MYILYVLRKTGPQYCIISNELVTKNDPVKNTTRKIKNKKTASIILYFHLLHGQVLVLKNRTFHQKVLSKNGLIRELRSISKFVTLQTGTQIITITILPDISKSKNNQ